MNPTFKRHLISAIVTFVAAFAIVVVPDIDTVSVDNLTDGTLVGLIFVGVRAGLKALLEMLIPKKNDTIRG